MSREFLNNLRKVHMELTGRIVRQEFVVHPDVYMELQRYLKATYGVSFDGVKILKDKNVSKSKIILKEYIYGETVPRIKIIKIVKSSPST